MVIGDDNKIHWDDAGKPVFTEPGKDEVVIVDIKNSEAPKIVATLPLTNTVIGPPTNLAVTPDESLALVANSIAYQQDGAGWKSVPDNKLFVIDLKSAPAKLIATVEVGKQPSGLAVNKSGSLLLIANRADSSVSVLTIKGQEVKLVDTVPVGDPAAAVAFTPDGKHALVAKNTVNKIAFLNVEGDKVTYDKTDLSVGVYPYNVQVMADGRFALAANQGNGGAADGGAGSVTVIDLKATPPHVVDYVGIDPIPEGLDVSPRADLAVALALNGSGAVPKGAWYAHPNTIVDVLSTAGGKVRKVGSVNAGGLAEGVAFSPDGKYLYVANFNDNNVQIYRVTGEKVVDTGKTLKLPGHPASMRSSVP
ncbi:MAG: YncE family protein [Hyphomicrobiales bacterium]|nr:YncE family protein [Hyphomicrobiales bacterium]